MTPNAEAINRLRRELDRAFQVVARPDHPMLLSGPDLLIGGDGKLTAVLFIGKSESDNGLLARITATRLAMPSNTKLLAFTPDDKNPSAPVINNVDELAGSRSVWQVIARYSTSDAYAKANRKDLSEMKRRHVEKYSFALLLSTLRRRHELPAVSAEAVIAELSIAESKNVFAPTQSPILRLRRPATEVMGTHVASLTSSRRPLQQLRTICDAGLNDGYILDTGVPYQRPDSHLSVLLVENWPTIRHDPDKPVRSAAFGCWIMARSSGAHDIYRLVERSRDPKYSRRWQNA